MMGLRKQETSKFENFFAIVQNAAEKIGSIFFLDAGDGRGFETETLEGEDLMGWLVPKEKVSTFKREWDTGDVSDEWSDLYVWATWENSHNPTIKFV